VPIDIILSTIPARHRERYSGSLRKLSSISPEPCPRSPGITVHVALETLSSISRNMHFWQRLFALSVDGLLLGALGAGIGLFAYDGLAALGDWGRLVGKADCRDQGRYGRRPALERQGVHTSSNHFLRTVLSKWRYDIGIASSWRGR